MVGGKLARPVRPCRVCFWPVTRERLPTRVLEELCPTRGPHAAQTKVLYGPVQVFAVVEVSYILTNCPCVDNLEFDVFDAGSSVPPYHVCYHCS